jgi:hypothetical protein
VSSLTFRPRVPVFDANIRVGDLSDHPAPCRDRAALLTEMDRHGVERAVIYHALTEEVSPVEGNLLLEPWLDTESRLVPQWSVLPTAASLAQLQALHDQRRVSSVRLHDTRVAGLPFRPWAYDRLLGWLSAEHIPAWIPLPRADAPAYCAGLCDELVTTLQGYPDLVTVLVGAHYVHYLQVRPLLTRLPNAHLELSRYEPIGEIEALCHEFSASRLVYGSWYWQYAMGPMLFYLHRTDLHEEELALICAGNLVRILGRVAS